MAKQKCVPITKTMSEKEIENDVALYATEDMKKYIYELDSHLKTVNYFLKVEVQTYFNIFSNAIETFFKISKGSFQYYFGQY